VWECCAQSWPLAASPALKNKQDAVYERATRAVTRTVSCAASASVPGSPCAWSSVCTPGVAARRVRTSSLHTLQTNFAELELGMRAARRAYGAGTLWTLRSLMAHDRPALALRWQGTSVCPAWRQHTRSLLRPAPVSAVCLAANRAGDAARQEQTVRRRAVLATAGACAAKCSVLYAAALERARGEARPAHARVPVHRQLHSYLASRAGRPAWPAQAPQAS